MTANMNYFTPLDASNPYAAAANEIIAQELAGKQPQQHPFALLTIGPPGAGKTTLLRYLAHQCGGQAANVPFQLCGLLGDQGVDATAVTAAPQDAAFGDALYINTVKYRETLAERTLQEDGLVRGRDYGIETGAPEQKTALAYVAAHDPQRHRQIMQTGSEIALQLLLRSVEQGIACVLDSTGGGFAVNDGADVTVPLMEAAKKSGADLFFLRMDVPLNVAQERVRADFEQGKKPFVDASRLAGDIERSEQAAGVIQACGTACGCSPVVITLDATLKADRNRSVLSSSLQHSAAPLPEGVSRN